MAPRRALARLTRWLVAALACLLLVPPAQAAMDYAKQVLIGADFHETDLRGVTFNLTNLREANFQGADLRNASLFGAKLQDANFSGADLREATLDSAVFEGSDLRNARLDDAFAFNTRFLNVRIDGADFRQWDRSALGRHIGYLPQTVELFAGTVAQNIARLGAADPAQVIAAAKAAVEAMLAKVHEGLRKPA